MDKGFSENSAQILGDLSRALRDLVANTGRFVVQVDAEQAQPRSGIQWDDHHVLTAAVFARSQEQVRVRLLTSPPGAGGQKSFRDIAARVVGHDPATGFVLVKTDEALDVGEIPRREEPVAVGELVVSVALPSYDGIEAKTGIVRCVGGPYSAARGGTVPGYIQTDASLFPGFAGGAVVDVQGKLVGVNAPGWAFGSETGGGGLIIPAGFAVDVGKRIAENRVPVRGYLGVRSQEAEISPALQEKLGRKQPYGLLVVTVESSSPAEKSGLVTGDILVAMEGRMLQSHEDLIRALDEVTAGTPVELEILRGGETHLATVTLEAVSDQSWWEGPGWQGPWSGHRRWHGSRESRHIREGARRMHRWFTNGTAG